MITLSDFSLSTPALLFPAISLLLLAYTNRFHSLAALVRDLHARWKVEADPGLEAQILNLKRRIRIIKLMQILGVASFFLCVFTMLLIFFQQMLAAEIVFAGGLVLLLISLALSIRELSISADALDILLDEHQEKHGRGRGA